MRWYYSSLISDFVVDDKNRILGELTNASGYGVDQTQVAAWVEQIRILQDQLKLFSGKIFFEFVIPRMGKRVDVIVLLESFAAIIEFKVGDKLYKSSAIDQAWDYALDLKNFHKTSHNMTLLPILVATNAERKDYFFRQSIHSDGVLNPVTVNSTQIAELLKAATANELYEYNQATEWEAGKYQPTPTIVEAALALYGGHNVEEIISRGAANLSETVSTVQGIINSARENRQKAICFVTGVPGAGKTLVGLDIATQNVDKESEAYSVYLSGNGPLVKVLQEALAMDSVSRSKSAENKISKGEARSTVKMFIQNVHHFRDDCIAQVDAPPIEHVVIFDESQRAWNREMTIDFMRRKKGLLEFNASEPEFLISCMDRHKDWAVIICLVGGGQEINRGEAGISEWLEAIQKNYSNWQVYSSPELAGNSYVSLEKYDEFKKTCRISEQRSLHLATSMRSFRAAQLSEFVNHIIARDGHSARQVLAKIRDRYPIVLTRDVQRGRQWLKEMSRGTQRYGMVVSSKAYRLRPHAIDVRMPVDPVHWFLRSKEDIRSSYYLEDVATEFQIQGLELDWVCVAWDADLRYQGGEWGHYNFVGSKWQKVNKPQNRQYLENAYRVLLTRARQGMVLVVPQGSGSDPTRQKTFYDPTYNFLQSIGIEEV